MKYQSIKKNIKGFIRLSILVIVSLIIFFEHSNTFADPIKTFQQDKEDKTVQEFKKVAAEIEKNLRRNPYQPEMEWRLARTHYSIAKKIKNEEAKKKQYDLCIYHSSQALKLQPNSATSLFFRALCRGKKGQIQGIWASLEVIGPFEKDMKRAVELEPSIQDGGPHRALGKLYLELPFFLGGNVGQSVYHLEKAVQLSPNYAENHLGLAQAYFANKNFESAKKSLLNLKGLTDNIIDDESLLKLRAAGQELMNKMTP